jgi:O-acetyl-ADP-ribose deacetylase (regulator of RNase III)
MEFQLNKTRIEIKTGDITEERVDAIVNAANSSLLGGGGVDGAIHRKAGPLLLKSCREIGGCPPGEARITKGFNLPAKWVIHTVGPVYHDGQMDEEKILYEAYFSSLKLADEYGIQSIAFPAISTGVYAYPKNEAALISLKSITAYLNQGSSIQTVKIILFSENDYKIYLRAISIEMND